LRRRHKEPAAEGQRPPDDPPILDHQHVIELGPETRLERE
jgi:hypothetical protein